MPGTRIRAANPGEAAALTALCLRSKAYWGYDDAFMQASAAALEITEVMIASECVLVAQDEHGAMLGVATLAPVDHATFELAHFFIEPKSLRSGVGRALFAAIVAETKRAGAAKLTILADPNATKFYERMGARLIGDAPSESIPGRRLPLLTYDM